MTTVTRVVNLRCTQPFCNHIGSVPIERVDSFTVGATSVCRCHPDKVSESLDVLAFECEVA